PRVPGCSCTCSRLEARGTVKAARHHPSPKFAFLQGGTRVGSWQSGGDDFCEVVAGEGLGIVTGVCQHLCHRVCQPTKGSSSIRDASGSRVRGEAANVKTRGGKTDKIV